MSRPTSKEIAAERWLFVFWSRHMPSLKVRFWRKAVIGQSSNVSRVHQETRTRRSFGLDMSQFVSEICENWWGCARLSGTSVLPSTADIVTARLHVSKVPMNEPAHAGGAGGAVKRL